MIEFHPPASFDKDRETISYTFPDTPQDFHDNPCPVCDVSPVVIFSPVVARRKKPA
jgi:hypothetical protein